MIVGGRDAELVCGLGFATGHFLPIPGAEGVLTADDSPEGRGAGLVRGFGCGLVRFLPISGAEGALTADDLPEGRGAELAAGRTSALAGSFRLPAKGR